MNREAVVNLAKEWIGKNEGDGSHKSIIDIYNNHKPLARGYKVKYTDAWCATTVSALAIELKCTDIIPTECGCNPMIQLFKNLGEWVEDDSYTPNPGDIIFYDWDDNGIGDCTGGSEHVGIVEFVSGGYITVIEGNKNDAVGRRKLKVNGKFIRGYGTPKYAKYGWIQDDIGWWYQKKDNTYPKSEWLELSGNWFYFNDKGYAVTGWQYIKGKWYWFDSNCYMKTGWQFINKNWYFFSKSGDMIKNKYIPSETTEHFYHWVNNDGAWTSSSYDPNAFGIYKE